MRFCKFKPSLNQKKSSGFTLIELLVTIAIIGFLVAAATYTFSVVRIRGRDATRKADLAQLRKAIEMYIQEYGEPPTTSSYGEANVGGWDSSSQGDFMPFLKGAVGSANLRNIEFMATVPKDPINNGTGDCGGGVSSGYQYCYYYYNDSNYRLGARLEGTNTTYWLINRM